MKTLKWFVINMGLAALFFFGLHKGVNGALNIALVITWITIVLSPFFLLKDVIKEMSRVGRSVPFLVSIVFDIAIFAALAWHGYFFTAVFYVIHIILQEGMWKEVSKLEFGDK